MNCSEFPDSSGVTEVAWVVIRNFRITGGQTLLYWGHLGRRDGDKSRLVKNSLLYSLLDRKIVFIADKNLNKLKAEELAPEKLAEANRRLKRIKSLPK
jgi:hypothetical protein